MKNLWLMLKDIVFEWHADKAPRLAAALAFYTMFTLAPLLIIVIAFAGLAFGQDAARGQIMGQVEGLVGFESAHAIQAFLEQVSTPKSGIIATVVGFATLVLGVWWVFGELQEALNTIWEVAPRPGRRLRDVLKVRLLSFATMLGVGFLLLVSLVLSAALSALGTLLFGVLPDFQLTLHVLSFVVSFAVITLLFAMIYKIVPDVLIAWSDVWIGAAVTALLYTAGKYAIGVYLGTSSTASAYGAAGSLVVILIWIYYSAQILFFGAEFTKAYAMRYGSRIVPLDIAVPVTEESRAQQGLPAPAVLVATEAVQQQHSPPARTRRAYDRYAAAAAGFVAGIIVTGVYALRR